MSGTPYESDQEPKQAKIQLEHNFRAKIHVNLSINYFDVNIISIIYYTYIWKYEYYKYIVYMYMLLLCEYNKCIYYTDTWKYEYNKYILYMCVCYK